MEKEPELDTDLEQSSLQEAIALHRQGRLPRAEAVYRRLLTADADHLDALHLYGVLCHQTGRLSEARALIERALVLKNDWPDAHNNLALVLEAQGEEEAALRHYRRALALAPDHVQALTNLGGLYRKQGRWEEGRRCFEKALQRAPGSAPVLNNLSVVALEACQPEQAADYAEQALAVAPDLVDAHLNLANARKNLRDFQGSLEALNRAVMLAPDHVMARWNRALLLLLLGPDEQAWAEYDWGLASPAFRYRRDFGCPVWGGEPLGGRTLLVYGEQGVGDEVFFLRYVSVLVKCAQTVIVDCDRRLVRLLQRRWPELYVHGGGRHDSLDWLKAYPRPDWQIPLGSLPRRVKVDPPKQGYLSPNRTLVTVMADRLAQLGPGLKVGISWRGGAHQRARSTRSVPLLQWAEMLRRPDVHFVNIQYGDWQEEVSACGEAGCRLVTWPDINPLVDLESFAALLVNLDLVISVDNSTVHLAGALGVPTWVLVPATPDWRWGTDGETTPWYETLTLFRQTQVGQWQAVIAAVNQRLSEWRGRPSGRSAHR